MCHLCRLWIELASTLTADGLHKQCPNMMTLTHPSSQTRSLCFLQLVHWLLKMLICWIWIRTELLHCIYWWISDFWKLRKQRKPVVCEMVFVSNFIQWYDFCKCNLTWEFTSLEWEANFLSDFFKTGYHVKLNTLTDVLFSHLWTTSMISFSSTAVRNIELGLFLMKSPFFSSDVIESRIFLASFDSNTYKLIIEAINYIIHIINNHIIIIKVMMVSTV